MSDPEDKKFYLFEQERIESFTNWKFSENMPCNKFAMAAAGFYKISTDEGDGCACFYCGKTLNEWASNDIPFEEHKSHSPSCMFIKLGRSEAQLKVSEFLDLIQGWILRKMDNAMEIEILQRTTFMDNIMNKIIAKK